MAANYKSPIEREVDRLFSEIQANRGECCRNPVTGGGFVWGVDPIAPQKKAAVVLLLAREWFAVYGPPDGPRLPLSDGDVEDYRNAGGLTAVVGFYARSLFRQGNDVHKHPSFDDFARGLMAITTGRQSIDKDENLKRRFPPRPLAGMTPAGFWDPPKRNARSLRDCYKPTSVTSTPLGG